MQLIFRFFFSTNQLYADSWAGSVYSVSRVQLRTFCVGSRQAADVFCTPPLQVFFPIILDQLLFCSPHSPLPISPSGPCHHICPPVLFCSFFLLLCFLFCFHLLFFLLLHKEGTGRIVYHECCFDIQTKWRWRCGYLPLVYSCHRLSASAHRKCALLGKRQIFNEKCRQTRVESV